MKEPYRGPYSTRKKFKLHYTGPNSHKYFLKSGIFSLKDIIKIKPTKNRSNRLRNLLNKSNTWGNCCKLNDRSSHDILLSPSSSSPPSSPSWSFWLLSSLSPDLINMASKTCTRTCKAIYWPWMERSVQEIRYGYFISGFHLVNIN